MQALKSSRRSSSGLRKKTRRSSPVCFTGDYHDELEDDALCETSASPSTAGISSTANSYEPDSSKFAQAQCHPEQSSMLQSSDNLLAFAALDFKLSSEDKFKKKKKKQLPKPSTFSSELGGPHRKSCKGSTGTQRRSTDSEGKSELLPKPGPVGEGMEFMSLPNILTSGVPCQGKASKGFFPVALVNALTEENLLANNQLQVGYCR